MSEQDAQGAGESGNEGFQPIESQDELNKFIGSTRAEERRKAAEKYADYDDLKAKADEYDRVVQQSKSESDQMAERVAALEQQLSESQTIALKARVQAKYGVSDDDADLFLTATDEGTLTKQAERLAQRDEDRKKQGNRAPLQGRTSSKSGEDQPLREMARQLFSSDD